MRRTKFSARRHKRSATRTPFRKQSQNDMKFKRYFSIHEHVLNILLTISCITNLSWEIFRIGLTIRELPTFFITSRYVAGCSYFLLNIVFTYILFIWENSRLQNKVKKKFYIQQLQHILLVASGKAHSVFKSLKTFVL